LFPQAFSTLSKFEKGKAIFSINKKYGVVRQNGAIVIDSNMMRGPL
jgi:hypothetical protein